MASMISELQKSLGMMVGYAADIGQRLLVAILLLLVGILVARIARRVMIRVLQAIHLDDYLNRVGIGEVTRHLGLGASVTAIVGFLVHWFLVLAFLLPASDVLGLPAVSGFVQQVVLYLPRVLGAVIIAAAGLALGALAAEITGNAARANNLPGAPGLSKLARVIVVVLALVMALGQIGLDTSLLQRSVEIVLMAAGLCLAIAFGLGGKEIAAEFLRDFVRRR